MVNIMLSIQPFYFKFMRFCSIPVSDIWYSLWSSSSPPLKCSNSIIKKVKTISIHIILVFDTVKPTQFKKHCKIDKAEHEETYLQSFNLDKFLISIYNVKIVLFIIVTHISSVKPTRRVNCFSSSLRIVMISQHYLVATYLHSYITTCIWFDKITVSDNLHMRSWSLNIILCPLSLISFLCGMLLFACIYNYMLPNFYENLISKFIWFKF